MRHKVCNLPEKLHFSPHLPPSFFTSLFSPDLHKMNELAAPQKHIDFGATGQREFSFLCSSTTVPYLQLFKITELYDYGKLTLKSVWRSKRYQITNRRFKDKGRA